jgi:pimeloyl-ACP methyl ester carboxylesterase
LSRAALAAACVTAAAGLAPNTAAAVLQPVRPRAVVVMVPGSGFNGAGTANVSRMSFKLDAWRSWGFRTKVASYRRGRAGLRDVTRFVEGVHRATPGLPLCVYGESSGGTWALLVAAAHPELVDCAVVLSAPTDQETLARAPDGPARHLARVVWPRYFGAGRADDLFEPFDVWRMAAPTTLPVLAVYSRGDQIVPPQQGELLVPLSPLIELRVLRRGRHPFVHADVAPPDFVAARRAARALVARAGSAAPAP